MAEQPPSRQISEIPATGEGLEAGRCVRLGLVSGPDPRGGLAAAPDAGDALCRVRSGETVVHRIHHHRPHPRRPVLPIVSLG